MHGSYLNTNLVNVKSGDILKVISVFEHSKRHLTIGNSYRVFSVKVHDKEHMKHRNSFTIVTDCGEKRKYKFKNMMFEKADGSDLYNDEQLRLLNEFTRGIEQSVVIWKDRKDSDREKDYESDRDYLINDYLVKIMKAK